MYGQRVYKTAINKGQESNKNKYNSKNCSTKFQYGIACSLRAAVFSL